MFSYTVYQSILCTFEVFLKEHHMKALILIITFCSFSIVNLKGQNYFTQIPFFDSCWIYSMDINQAGHMFASASFQNNSRNGVYRSTNDGQSWDFVLSFNLFGNAGLDITNEGIIYALADWGLEGSLYKSTDNGQTWINKMVPLDIYWCNNEIFCQGDDTLFISQYAGSSFRLIRSFDDGLNWDTVFFRDQYSAEAIRDIVFGSNGEMFMAVSGFFQGAGGLFKSTDYGTTWFLFDLPGLMVEDLAYNSTGDLYISTMHLTQGGLYVVFANEHSAIYFYPLTDFTSMVVNSSGDIFAGNFYYPAVYHSADNGLTYEWITTGLGAQPEYMYIDSDQYIYATNASRIWRSSEPTITSANSVTSNPFTIYPNPCRDILHGHFKQGRSISQFQILDFSGRLVDSGSIFEDDFSVDVSSLKPGLYCLTVISGKVYSKTFIKV
jgi:hypothetical protein